MAITFIKPYCYRNFIIIKRYHMRSKYTYMSVCMYVVVVFVVQPAADMKFIFVVIKNKIF